jgi:hypothetical protein
MIAPISPTKTALEAATRPTLMWEMPGALLAAQPASAKVHARATLLPRTALGIMSSVIAHI